MPDPIKFVGAHPEGPTETHYLTVWDIERHHGHMHVRLDSDCGLTMEAALYGHVQGADDPPTCRDCFTHGLNPKALSDVLGALATAGDL